MSAALTTQMLTPSLRRVYRSRAACTAISPSGACSDPTCTWLSPRLPRTNTSYSGQSRRAVARAGSTGTSGPVGTAPCPPSAVRSLLTARLRPRSAPRSLALPAMLARASLSRSCRVLLGVRGGGLGDPGVVVAGRPAPRDADVVHRAGAADHPLELHPVDRAEPPVAARLVPGEVAVGQRHPEELRLRHRHVDEALPQLVVGVPLDAP